MAKRKKPEECPNCGGEVCPHCGKALEDKEQAPTYIPYPIYPPTYIQPYIYPWPTWQPIWFDTTGTSTVATFTTTSFPPEGVTINGN